MCDVKQFRKNLGMEAKDVALVIGVTHESYCDIEDGDPDDASLILNNGQLFHLSVLLGLQPTQILKWPQNNRMGNLAKFRESVNEAYAKVEYSEREQVTEFLGWDCYDIISSPDRLVVEYPASMIEIACQALKIDKSAVITELFWDYVTRTKKFTDNILTKELDTPAAPSKDIGDGVVIAQRLLHCRSTHFRLNIYAPQKLEGGEFRCNARCEGIDNLNIPSAMGIDSVQALILQLHVIQKTLKQSNSPVYWAYGSGDNFGFPLIPVEAYLHGDEHREQFERDLEDRLNQDNKKFLEIYRSRALKKGAE